MPPNPKKKMNAAEDFMLLLVHTYVSQAARVLQLTQPSSSVRQLASAIVDQFVHLLNLTSVISPDSTDRVNLYAIELLSLGLLWHGFHDSVREADGDRILRYWKFLLVVFKSTSHRNYVKEAVNVLYQYYYDLSEREKAQLLWSRCVNTRGYPGANIPCDLYMEHLNRRLKQVIRGMGANISAARVKSAGKAIASVQSVCQIFEKQTSVQIHSDHHPYPSFGKDFHTISKVLQKENVFGVLPGREYPTFKFTKGILETLTRTQLKQKVERSIKQLA